MSRQGKVFYKDFESGIIREDEEGYYFKYNREYLENPDAFPVSFTLPLQESPFLSKTMFAFFDGLIPEGWLLNVAIQTWKIDLRDRMGLLLACCKDCIGAVSIVPVDGDVHE